MGPKKHPLQTDADQLRDGVETRVTFCACGTAIGPRAARCERCGHRLAQARYQITEKGKATRVRYNHGVARKLAHARYRATARVQQRRSDSNARRIFVNKAYVGHAATVELAETIRRYVRERTSAFIERQSARAQAEGVTSGAVPTQTELRTDRLGGRHLAPGNRGAEER